MDHTKVHSVFQSVPPNTMTYILNLYDKAAGSLLPNTALPRLLPLHHCSCTMATGGMYFHVQDMVRYQLRSWSKNSLHTSSLMHFGHTVDNNRR